MQLVGGWRHREPDRSIFLKSVKGEAAFARKTKQMANDFEVFWLDALNFPMRSMIVQ
jgi:hypothetical protein